MDIVDIIVLLGLLAAISFFGVFTALRGAKQTSAAQILHGSNVSVVTSALSVCSGFLSAVSLLGFPAEIYYQGTMLFWYGPMYMIAFPIVAYYFLPVFYNMKLTSIYETWLYVSVALYAPALALSTVISIPLSVSIFITAVLAALYVTLGGAKASIYTSALQMALILANMVLIFSISLYHFGFNNILETAVAGGRLQLFDFRIDPRIRHSVWSLIIGGTGNILCLFAANQLTVQRYMAMSSLRSAQCFFLISLLMSYPQYPEWLDFLRHPFIAQVKLQYSFILSTASASYSALAAVFIEDVIKQFQMKVQKHEPMELKTSILLARYLPLLFCCLSMVIAYLCSIMDTMVLQVSFSIFGIAGGPVLSVFCLGMFFPKIKGLAAFTAQLASTVFCVFIAAGALLNHVRPVGLPINETCEENNVTLEFVQKPEYGLVFPLQSNSWLIQLFRISYQYYSICALLVAFIVAHIVQCFSGYNEHFSVEAKLLSPLFQSTRKRKEIILDYASGIRKDGEIPLGTIK
ncbi:unnamed protein product [Onchocerca ochengi]|uniref:Sodium-coupled monocarboxylate transporter 1 n=1 Tax=Onchocerca ochengi TaxID=42157 RepID=A0A182E150_ONCOC|nr:unnamed protein product [Onchocerca ochengi]